MKNVRTNKKEAHFLAGTKPLKVINNKHRKLLKRERTPQEKKMAAIHFTTIPCKPNTGQSADEVLLKK